MFYYGFDGNSIVEDKCLSALKGDGKKKLEHAAIIINNINEKPSATDMCKLSDVINWLFLTNVKQITVYDQKGAMMNSISELEKKINTPKANYSKFTVKENNIQIEKEKQKIEVNFIKEESMLLEVAKRRSK